MAWKLGSELSTQDQAIVLIKFRPSLAPPEPEWLAYTRFRVKANGRLDKRATNCWPAPTLAMFGWPGAT